MPAFSKLYYKSLFYAIARYSGMTAERKLNSLLCELDDLLLKAPALFDNRHKVDAIFHMSSELRAYNHPHVYSEAIQNDALNNYIQYILDDFFSSPVDRTWR
jgi:hypothetical protein